MLCLMSFYMDYTKKHYIIPYTTCEYAFVTCTYIFITILLEYLANCAVPSTLKSFPHFDEYTTDPKKHCVEKKVINE